MRQNLPVTGRNLELPKDANILSTALLQIVGGDKLIIPFC